MNSEGEGEGAPFSAGGVAGNSGAEGRFGPGGGEEETAAERAFWEKYERAMAGAGVEERFWLWHRRHVERFIRFLKPKRLKMAEPSDVGEFLVRMRRLPDVEGWHIRQADWALRILYQTIIKSGWAGEWSVPLPLEEV